MADIKQGILEVGTNGSGEVVINHPDLLPDENGVGHIVFSVEQARDLANLLLSKSADAAVERGDLKTTFTNPQDNAKGASFVALTPNFPAKVVPVDLSQYNDMLFKPG